MRKEKQDKDSQKNKRIKRHFFCKWPSVIAYLVVMVGLYSTDVIAKYATEVDGTAMATVAAMNNSVENISFSTEGLNKPGDTITMNFNVVNYLEGKICEVGQTYSLVVSNTGNLPLVCNLMGSTDDINNSFGHSGSLVQTGTVTNHSILTGGRFEQGYLTVHSYALTVTWPVEMTNEQFSDEIDLLNVEVISEQVNL